MRNKQQKEMKNGKSKKKINFRWIWGGAFIFLMMVWLANVLFNWLFPDSLTISLNKINQMSTSEINKQHVHDYIQLTEGLKDRTTQQFNQVTDKSTIGELEGIKKELNHLKSKTQTNDKALIPLKDYYEQQIQLEKQIIDRTIAEKENHNFFISFKIRELKKEYNDNVPNEQKIIIALLDKAKIPHKILHDGSLYYQPYHN